MDATPAGPLDIPALVAALTLDEKAALCSGSGFWHTRAIDRLGIPAIMVSDGPHGLRIQADGGDHLGLDASLPATCFPPAVTVASSWDTDLARRIGDAIGTESRAAGLAVVLGPGVNIKRSPRCGRNFEYYSEDPLLTGELAVAMVDGIQSHGVGASLKHFAANNQETDRLRVSAEIDARTLREIYLPAFERVVTRARPWTVMCAYNRINGVYASQDPWLLTDLLRGEWGFDGLVVSDWGAVNDPVAAVAAGLDLEMPSTGGVSAQTLATAVTDGVLGETELDLAVTRVLTLVERARAGAATAPTSTEAAPDFDAHHALARTAAAQGAVLLKNDGGILPLHLEPGRRLAVIGEFARTPRYQGAGSSQVNPTRVDDALTALRDAVPGGVVVDFSPGFTVDRAEPDDPSLAADAVRCATEADAVVVFLGLPAAQESEGFDRTHLALPDRQVAVLEQVATVNPKVIVVLSNGGVVTTAECDRHAAALLECWLGGQASGSAAADLLLGHANPSGKLAETIPHRLEDTPSHLNFPGAERVVRYGEGIFVGYRHHDTVARDVAYPFGFGLSYTTFEYHTLVVEEIAEDGADPFALDRPVVRVGATIANSGTVAGADVVQVYVGAPDSTLPRPIHELKAFTKVLLEPGAEQAVEWTLTARDLAAWSTRLGGWSFEPGRYIVAVAASSRDRRLVGTIDLPGVQVAVPLDRESTLAEWLAHPVGHDLFVHELRNGPAGDLSALLDDEATLRMIGPFPMVRLLTMLGGAIPLSTLDDLLAQVADPARTERV